MTIKIYNDLSEVKKQSADYRFDQSLVSIFGYDILCNDLASFYIAAKDIFIQKIYDFNTENNAPFVIDGGAHIGLFSLYTKLRYPDAQIIAFEPDPGALTLLNKNIQGNNLKNIQIISGALTDKDGQTDFSTGLSDGCTIFGEENRIQVNTYNLGPFVKSNIDCLKLNIEGSEYDAIKSIEPKLHLIDKIFIEYHGFPETGQTLHKILDILDRNNFRYTIHDYDHETNPFSKPPFTLDRGTKFFLLIYAVNLNSAEK